MERNKKNFKSPNHNKINGGEDEWWKKSKQTKQKNIWFLYSNKANCLLFSCVIYLCHMSGENHRFSNENLHTANGFWLKCNREIFETIFNSQLNSTKYLFCISFFHVIDKWRGFENIANCDVIMIEQKQFLNVNYLFVGFSLFHICMKDIFGRLLMIYFYL